MPFGTFLERASWHRKFQSLMPYRVHEVLLVSSSYDAFVLEEDGSLQDRLFSEYQNLQLSWAPRITHAASAREALQLLEERKFDLVITVVRLQELEAGRFSQLVKEQYADLPVVLLAFDEADLGHFPDGEVPATIDRAVLWTGDAGILIAAIKLIEDERNVAHDTHMGGIQVILVVEDSLRAYSSFLSSIYPELLEQSNSLVAEGLNPSHRLMRRRARPKILLANTFDEALRYYERYRDHTFALFSDVRYPVDDTEHEEAGIEMARRLRDADADLPILLMSTEAHHARSAAGLGAWFVDKNAADFEYRVRMFLQEALGFGDFVFRLKNRTVVGRAGDIYEMEQAIPNVPIESIVYHGGRNHFSTWLKARCMFESARRIRPVGVDDFDTVEEVREFLVRVLRTARKREQEGVVTDFSPGQYGSESRFVRVGLGSLGGKGRGLAFVNSMIVRHSLLERYEGMEIRIPKSVVVGAQAFERFMQQIPIAELLALDEDRDVTLRMLGGQLDPEVLRNLRSAFDMLRGPIAVRSSSLLEDSRFQPFAGVYATVLLPNSHEDPEVRFYELCQALKNVYASAFWGDARRYIASTPHELDDQKMAVVVQQVVGRARGDRYYPPVSGVAQSYNFYPVGAQRPSDGVGVLALGLGHTVVGGRHAMRFSPGAPTATIQFSNPRSLMRNAQTEFFALDLSRTRLDLLGGPDVSLTMHDLQTAEDDGMLGMVGSVYCAADDMVRENLTLPGPRVVTFNNLLKWNMLPLAEALTDLLDMLRDAVGGEVEIEFALDVPPADHGKRRKARLYVLQVRPMVTPVGPRLQVDLDAVPEELLLFRTRRALGIGLIDNICDIVYVQFDAVDAGTSRSIVPEIRARNEALVAEERPYVLIGPGRWGTSDPLLGIPIDWPDIAGAKVVVETPMGGRFVEPSQGTHFFHNLTTHRVGYLTVTPNEGYFDRAWLDAQPALYETEAVRHVRLEAPLAVLLEGHRGGGAVWKSSLDWGDDEEPAL